MKIHVYIKRLNCGLRLDVCAAREFIDLDCSENWRNRNHPVNALEIVKIMQMKVYSKKS